MSSKDYIRLKMTRKSEFPSVFTNERSQIVSRTRIPLATSNDIFSSLHLDSRRASSSPALPEAIKFVARQESFYIRKEFNSHRTRLEHQHGRGCIVLGHQHGGREFI